MEEETYETVNVAAKVTAISVPSKPPKSNKSTPLNLPEDTDLLNVAIIKEQKPDKPVKPKKLLNSVDECDHLSIPPQHLIPATVNIIDNEKCTRRQ